jgi:hypothetical protein
LTRDRCAGRSRSGYVGLDKACIFAQAFFKKACVSPVYHAATFFSIKPFLKRFSLKPFLKRLAIKLFFEKACGHTFLVKGL